MINCKDKKSYLKDSAKIHEEVAFAVSLNALSLIEGKGKLKGQLKEIATHLGEEDNPVVMLAKIKNF